MSNYSDDSDFVPSEEDLEDELEEEESDDLNLSDFEKDMSVERVSGSDSDDSEEITGSNVYSSLNISKKISVLKTGINSKGRRDNKSHVCVYCDTFTTNVARHLSLKHQNEPEVAKILILPKRSKERRKMWDVLVKKGDFNHNYGVLEKGNGIFIPKYRAKTDNDCKAYLPCQFCKGFYKKSDLWKHQKTCKKTWSVNDVSIPPMRSGKLLLPVGDTKLNRLLYDHVITKMKDDQVRSTLEGDFLIMRFGHRLYEEQGHFQHRHQYIAQKMRELGRLLEILKTKHNIPCLEDSMRASNWESLVEAVKNLADFDKETQTFGIPSLALKIGFSMKKCAEDLLFFSIRNENEQQKQIADTFLQLYSCDWKTSISAKALNSLSQRKFNKTQLLPLVEDVVKMNSYLNKRAEEIKKNWTEESYAEFAKICLAQVILFNRKRSGEAERMTVKGVHDSKRGGHVDPVVKDSLSEFEKHLCKTHLRVEILGKKGRKVPVLLTKAMQTNIELLLKKRSSDSEYLFARANNSCSHYRGSDSIREFASKCGAKHADLITSTKLRKQLATLAQVLNLKENSQDILATFQGHDIRIHREFYRLPSDALELAKVSRLLHCINNGTISKYKGLDFDEIEFDKGMLFHFLL